MLCHVTAIVRPGARVVAIDPAGRVLLFESEEPVAAGGLETRVFWVTPGGGLESGETFEQAARRELREETGIDAEVAGPSVLEEEAAGHHPDYGGQEVLYRARIFVVRLRADEVDALSRDAVAAAGYGRHRWWSLEELEQTSEGISPPGLAAILRAALGTTA